MRKTARKRVAKVRKKRAVGRERPSATPDEFDRIYELWSLVYASLATSKTCGLPDVVRHLQAACDHLEGELSRAR